MDAGRRKKRWMALVVWMLIALGLLLAPSPREWGAFGRKFSASFDRILPVVQPIVHVVLMAACAFLLMGVFSRRTLGFAVSCSFGTAVVLAVALELLQSLLPPGFARQCDVADLVPAFAGALVGCVIGIVPRAFAERAK